MILTCPRCFATYNVPDAVLTGQGRKVRCSSCHFEWTEQPPPHAAIAGLAPEPVFTPEPAPHVAPVAEPAPPPRRSAPLPKKAAGAGFSLKKLGSGVALLVLGVAVLGAGVVLLRERLGHMSPVMADFYEDIGLPVEGPAEWFRFEGVKLEKSEADGQLVFAVHGQVINQSRRTRTLPPLRLYWLSSRQESGPETIIKADVLQLAPGQSAGFGGQLVGVDASLGGEIKVNFKQQDEAAAAHDAVPAHEAAAAHDAAPPAHEPAHTAVAKPTSPHEPAAPAHEPAAAPAHEMTAPAPAPEVQHGAAPAHEAAPPHEAPVHEPAPVTTHETPAPPTAPHEEPSHGTAPVH